MSVSGASGTTETEAPPVDSDPLDRLGTVVGRGQQPDQTMNEMALRKHASIRASRINPDDLRGLSSQVGGSHDGRLSNGVPGPSHVNPQGEPPRMDVDPL